MKRREFVWSVLAGSVASPVVAEPAVEKQGHHHDQVDGPLATATVSFGEWRVTDDPLDRHPNASPAAENGHQLIPSTVKIKAGGTVNFIIAGLHQVQVFDDGHQPDDIDISLTTPTTGTPAGVPLIDDSIRRLYRGLDPSLHPRDRVEVVRFAHPGTYLVICGVLGHFQDGMIGYVRVLPSR